jgi:hypothetical protein
LKWFRKEYSAPPAPAGQEENHKPYARSLERGPILTLACRLGKDFGSREKPGFFTRMALERVE